MDGKEKVTASTDELVKQMQHDELDGAEKLSIRDYARMRSMQPQLVHYYISQGRLKPETCICGRKVLDVKDADDFFATKKDRRTHG